MSDNYICIKNMCYPDLLPYDHTTKTLEEVQKLENTELLVSKCEKLIDDIQTYLDGFGFSYKKITISSDIGAIVKEGYVELAKERLQAAFKKVPKGQGISYFNCKSIMISDIEENMVKDVMPLSFRPDYRYIGHGKDIWENRIEATIVYHPEKYGKIFKNRIYGYVNFELFINMLRERGYKVYINDYGECKRLNDCIRAIRTTSLAAICIEKSYELSKDSEAPTYQKV